MNAAREHKKRAKTTGAPKSRFLKPLAESVILQAMEDILSNRGRDENINFFQGDGFRLYANVAEMRPREKNILMRLITESLSGQTFAARNNERFCLKDYKSAFGRKRMKAI